MERVRRRRYEGEESRCVWLSTRKRNSTEEAGAAAASNYFNIFFAFFWVKIT